MNPKIQDSCSLEIFNIYLLTSLFFNEVSSEHGWNMSLSFPQVNGWNLNKFNQKINQCCHDVMRNYLTKYKQAIIIANGNSGKIRIELFLLAGWFTAFVWFKGFIFETNTLLIWDHLKAFVDADAAWLNKSLNFSKTFACICSSESCVKLRKATM